MLRLSRKSSWWAALGVILAIPEALAHSQGLTAGPPSGAPEAGVRMVAEGSITLDGRMDEPAWAHAPVIDLIQQDPHPGAPTPFRTEIRLLADGKHLYLGVTCVDPDPGRLSLHSLARDSDQTHDDHLTIVLDPFDSQRLGYVFQVNAGGGRTDGLISPASSLPNYDWDGIWNAKVRRTADGWVAEIEIDTQSLQFRHGVDRWRMNVQRYVPREQLSLQWAGITLDANIFDLSRMGTLTGVATLQQGHGLDVQPYVLLRQDSLRGNTAAQVGGDLQYNVTPNLAAILTVNPDFAEAEADTQQVNLTPYSLFYPEKRRFFSEGSNLFAFGAGLADNDTFLPFYSRRVGLVNGQPVRVDGGIKLLGTAGPWSIGMLDVETGRSSVSGPTNLFAGRLMYDVNQHLRLGTLLTRGDPTGQSRNQFAGVDAIWHTASFRGDKNLTLSGWAARSSDPLPGDHSGWGLHAEYPNDLWSGFASFNVFGDALDPALGFLPRPGTRQYDVYLDYRPRPISPALNWVRQFFYQLEVLQVDDLHGVTQTRRIFTAPFNVDAQPGEHYEFDWIPEYEALTAPFEIAPGVTVPVGRYHFERYHFEAQSSAARPWRIGSMVEIGGFYSGRLTQYMPFISWNAWQGELALKFSNETDFGYLPQGHFIRRLYVLQAAYSFNPDLVVSTLAQYDSSAGHIGVNARLQWTIAPGRDFFLVVNHGIEASVTDPNARSLPVANVVTAKLRWDFRE
jgi:hypothetical protein